MGILGMWVGIDTTMLAETNVSSRTRGPHSTRMVRLNVDQERLDVIRNWDGREKEVDG